jgi:hypothetical protein
VLDLVTTEGKASQQTVDMNLTAVSAYTWVIMINIATGMVFQSTTADWAGGLACKIKEALDTKFKPKYTMSYVDLRRDLNAIVMKKNDDPAGLFEQISDIKNIYNSDAYTIDEDRLYTPVTQCDYAQLSSEVALRCSI